MGDLEKNSVVLPIVEPNFSPSCPEAAVLEEAEELTLRRGEEGGLRTFIDTGKVGDSKPSLKPLKEKSGKGCTTHISK